MASSPFLLSTTLCPPFKTEAICVLEWTNTHTHTHMHTWKNTFHLLWPCWFSSPTSRELSDRWAGLLNIPFLQFIASHPLSATLCKLLLKPKSHPLSRQFCFLLHWENYEYQRRILLISQPLHYKHICIHTNISFLYLLNSVCRYCLLLRQLVYLSC